MLYVYNNTHRSFSNYTPHTIKILSKKSPTPHPLYLIWWGPVYHLSFPLVKEGWATKMSHHVHHTSSLQINWNWNPPNFLPHLVHYTLSLSRSSFSKSARVCLVFIFGKKVKHLCNLPIWNSPWKPSKEAISRLGFSPMTPLVTLFFSLYVCILLNCLNVKVLNFFTLM